MFSHGDRSFDLSSSSSSPLYSPRSSPSPGPSPTHLRRSPMESNIANGKAPTRRKSGNLLSSALNRSNTMNDRALPQTPDIDSSYDGGPGTPMFESGASTPLLSAGGPGSLPNVPSQSLQVAHDTQRSAITRRLQSWNYLKSVHQGDQLHWFNTIRISKAELEAYYQPALNGAHPPFGTSNQAPSSATAKAFTPLALQKRATRFMVLGLSLGPLLDIANPHDFLKALLLTSQEYDQISDENLLKPKMKSLLRATTKGNRARSGTTSGAVQANDASNNSDDLASLYWPNIPFELDYFQCLFSLCDILIETYSKILAYLGGHSPLGSPASFMQSTQAAYNPPTTGNSLAVPGQPSFFPSTPNGSLSPALLEVMAKADAKLKKISSMLIKELDGLARQAIKDELSALDFGGGMSLFDGE